MIAITNSNDSAYRPGRSTNLYTMIAITNSNDSAYRPGRSTSLYTMVAIQSQMIQFTDPEGVEVCRS